MVYQNPPTINYDQTGWSGRFYEKTLLGDVYSFGGVSTALVAANATATGLTATAQPIIGVYNPANSGKKLVIVETMILITSVAASSVSPGAFVWVTATGQGAISTGGTPLQRNLGSVSISQAKGLALSVALTGLSGSLTNTNHPFNSTQVVAQEPATIAPMMGGQSAEVNEGSWIVAPGCFLGVMGTTSTTTISVAPRIMWVEMKA